MGIAQADRIHSLGAQLLGVFLVFGILSHGLCAEAAPTQTKFNVGYHVLDLKCREDGPEQVLTVAVWYPTAAKAKLYNYGGPTNGNVAVDAAPDAAGGPHPLLVFSHGYGGSGIGAVFFTEALAARGWIVAAPDHHDRYSAVRIRTGQVKDFNRLGLLLHAKEIAASGPGDRGKYLYRLDEMSCALDGMRASEPFGKLIARDRIAVGGHSLGGFTALGLSGTIKERHDSRIRAVVLFSTGAGGYLYREDELKKIQIPSMLFIGEREVNQRRGSKTMGELSAKIYRNVSRPKYYLEINGANHFSFNNCFSHNRVSRAMCGTEQQFAVIRRYAIALLEKHVAGRDDSDGALTRSDLLLTRYDKEPGLSVSEDAPEAPSTETRQSEPGASAGVDKPRR